LLEGQDAILTNSLTIFEEPLSASLCTLDSSLLDDFDFDLEEEAFAADADLEADADFDVDEEDFEVRVVLGSDMGGVVVVLNGWRGQCLWFVDGKAVDEATWTEAAVRRTQYTTSCVQSKAVVAVSQRCAKHVRTMLGDGCGVAVCGGVRGLMGPASVVRAAAGRRAAD
jgi:hypothetical protein